MNNNYLIYGEDLFLIKENIKKIINASKINEDSIIKYNMEENTIETLVEELNMYDMFGNRKIVMSDNSIFLSSEVKKDNNYNTDLLLEYLKNPNPESILIIVLNKNIDERKKISKELKKLCTVINCNKLSDYDLFDYVKNRLIKNGFKVNNSSIDLIIKYIGNDLMNLNNELNKLMMYKLQERIITDNDVKSIISKNIHNNVFDLIDSVVSNNKVKIFEIYEDLMKNSDEEPTKIIVMLANQFRLILQTKLLINDGMNESEIAKKLGIHPYRIKLAHEKSKTIDTNKLIKYLVDLANLDIDIKSGKVNKNIGLELFFLNM
ncbi:MAG: DNA polymerase III subunit delta [Bacilli bacterium]|nr:DNA polymerase III subunit delta [Bacilli bacterium]